MIDDGKFVPRWVYDDVKKQVEKLDNPEVKVIINGHRYNIT